MTGDGALIIGAEANGDDTLGGDGIFGGLSTLSGEATFGGEYVRGEASVAGERSPVGDAIDGNGIAERANTFTDGVPATCSGSVLKSRGTAEGSSVEPGVYGVPACHCLRSPSPTRCCGTGASGIASNGDDGAVSMPTSRRTRVTGRKSSTISLCTPFASVSGVACTPLVLYCFLLLPPILAARPRRLDPPPPPPPFPPFEPSSLCPPSSSLSPSSSSSPSILLASCLSCQSLSLCSLHCFCQLSSGGGGGGCAMYKCGKILGEPTSLDAYRCILGTLSHALWNPTPHGMPCEGELGVVCVSTGATVAGGGGGGVDTGEDVRSDSM